LSLNGILYGNLFDFRYLLELDMTAAKSGSASSVGGSRIARTIAALLLPICVACARPAPENANTFGFNVTRGPAPSASERYCAWYGSQRGDILFFGQAAFWSSYRAAGGEPTADLERPGPRLIGRFDLAREELLPPLDTDAVEALGGVWDVLAHPNGRVYFTTYFESAGYVDPSDGRVSLFETLGPGLNELALGPEQSLLVSRYGRAGDGGGSVLLLDPDGRLLREYELPAPEGFVLAPKTVAYDPLADEIWVTTDLLAKVSEAEGTPPSTAGRHPTLILKRDGRVRARISDDEGAPGSTDRTPSGEVQFVRFDSTGRGYAALVEGTRLELLEFPPTQAARDLTQTRRILLDSQFPRDFDFVQDLHIAADGRIAVTRWSGEIHVLTPSGEPRSVAFPQPAPGGLYYTAVVRGERVCATYCADVTIVCGPAP